MKNQYILKTNVNISHVFCTHCGRAKIQKFCSINEIEQYFNTVDVLRQSVDYLCRCNRNSLYLVPKKEMENIIEICIKKCSNTD